MTSEEVIKAVKDIPTYILEDDIRLYHKYASELVPYSLVVDVGTGLAKSAISLALSNPKVRILTFDTGVYPLERGWAKDTHEYTELIKNRLDFHNIKNVTTHLEDILLYDFELCSIDLLHIDGEKEVEEDILEDMLQFVRPGGIILARNADRFSNRGTDLLSAYTEPVEKSGKIQVVKKIL